MQESLTDEETRWLESATRHGIATEAPRRKRRRRKKKPRKRREWKGAHARAEIAKARRALDRAGGFWRADVNDRGRLV